MWVHIFYLFGVKIFGGLGANVIHFAVAYSRLKIEHSHLLSSALFFLFGNRRTFQKSKIVITCFTEQSLSLSLCVFGIPSLCSIFAVGVIKQLLLWHRALLLFIKMSWTPQREMPHQHICAILTAAQFTSCCLLPRNRKYYLRCHN